MSEKNDDDKQVFFLTSTAALALAILAQTDSSLGGATQEMIEVAKRKRPQVEAFDVTGMITTGLAQLDDAPEDDDRSDNKEKDKDEDEEGWHSSHSSHSSHASHFSSRET